MIGIYCYFDKENNDEIVYVGKDSSINRKSRHHAHLSPSRYNEQQINRVLQNNPDRYGYKVLKSWKKQNHTPTLSNVLEILYIRRYSPKFNFTIGGEGILGNKRSDEVKSKISKTKKENVEKISGCHNPRYNVEVPPPLELLDEYENSDMTQKELAQKYRVTRGTIYYRISKALKLKGDSKSFVNRRHCPPIHKGEDSPNYKHHIPSYSALLEEYENGTNIVELSKKYLCSTSTIHRRIQKARERRHAI